MTRDWYLDNIYKYLYWIYLSKIIISNIILIKAPLLFTSSQRTSHPKITSHQRTKSTIKLQTNAKRRIFQVRSLYYNQSKGENKIFHPYFDIIQRNDDPESIHVRELRTHKLWTTTTTASAPEATTAPEPTRTPTGTKINTPVARTTTGTIPTRRTTGRQCLHHQNGPARN